MSHTTSEQNRMLRVILGTLFLVLAAFAGYQIALTVLNRHKLVSFHALFLVLCCATALLRATFMFTEAYKHMPRLGFLTDDFPLSLQMATFSLLIIFFLSVVHKNFWAKYYLRILVVWGLLNGVLLGVLLYVFLAECDHKPCEDHLAWHATYAAVYLLLAAALATAGVKVTLTIRRRGHASAPELQNRSWFQVLSVTLAICVCFLTRAVYNFVVLSGHWLIRESTFNFFVFACLLTWDIIPTALVLLFFRTIPSPDQRLQALIGSRSPQLHPATPTPEPSRLFDDDRRYDSDEEGHMPLPIPMSWEATSPLSLRAYGLSVSPPASALTTPPNPRSHHPS